jgi:hypothetical protein
MNSPKAITFSYTATRKNPVTNVSIPERDSVVLPQPRFVLNRLDSLSPASFNP